MSRRVQVYPPLTQYSEDKFLDVDASSNAAETSPQHVSMLSPEERFPHLHIMLRHRSLPFKEAYSREETRQVLGITDKTLGRWVDQGAIKIYDLPGICASAQDIEDCLVHRRKRPNRDQNDGSDNVL